MTTKRKFTQLTILCNEAKTKGAEVDFHIKLIDAFFQRWQKKGLSKEDINDLNHLYKILRQIK